MALDAANSIQAENSLEKMMAHQMATLHELGMRYSARAMECRFPDQSIESARYAGAATRCMATYQSGMATLHRIRGGEQRVTVQYVSVGPNEQAVVGITPAPR